MQEVLLAACKRRWQLRPFHHLQQRPASWRRLCQFLWPAAHKLCAFPARACGRQMSSAGTGWSGRWGYKPLHQIKYFELKQVFRVKRPWGYCPNSNYLLFSSVASQDTTTCQSNAPTYAHPAWTHWHGQAVHAFSFLWIPPHLELYQTIWLVMHMLYCLATLIVFLHFKT